MAGAEFSASSAELGPKNSKSKSAERTIADKFIDFVMARNSYHSLLGDAAYGTFAFLRFAF